MTSFHINYRDFIHLDIIYITLDIIKSCQNHLLHRAEESLMITKILSQLDNTAQLL